MKIRIGFVTNSSSTNHVIAWNGNNDDLRNFLFNYKEYFLIDDKITIEEIIDQILSMVDKKKSSEEKIKELNEDISAIKNGLSFSSLMYTKYYNDLLIEKNKIIQKLKNKEWSLDLFFGEFEDDFSNKSFKKRMYEIGTNSDPIDIDSEDFAYSTQWE